MNDLEEGDEIDAACSVANSRVCFRAALKLMTGKWKGEILWSLRGGKRRFGELMRSIDGITQHMLTTQLRELERHGLVTRTVFAEVPPRVEYEMTEAAQDLRHVFEAIRHWSEKHGDTLNLEMDDEEADTTPGRVARIA